MKYLNLFQTKVKSVIALLAIVNSVKAQVEIHKAKQVFTCDSTFQIANAMVIENGKILEVGNFKEIKKNYIKPKIVKHGNNFIYPGFIDAHCHFLAYCQGLKEANLFGCKSSKEVISRLVEFQKTNQHPWILGRGWDQNLFPGKMYPDLKDLDSAFPNTPVLLKRVDGHAAWLNSKAIAMLKIDPRNRIAGGDYVLKNGVFTGIVLDNVLDLVYPKIPEQDSKTMQESIQTGQNTCLSYGLTTIDEAGLSAKQVKLYDTLQKQNLIKLRVYAMLEPSQENLNKAIYGPIQNPWLHVGGFKFYMDGALGSRGALLKHDYCDRMGYKGLLLQNLTEFETQCQILYYNNWQVCVHAIGDSANALALSIMKRIIVEPNDQRWRIEHAQIIDSSDIPLFDGKTILPSVQPTHATSDATWALKRICESNKQEAYPYQSLLKQCGMIALGTDFPVEDPSTIRTFYSAVTRMDLDGFLDSGFIPTEALSRKEALLGMTYWAAFANKEENYKGSLEKGKVADFIVMDKNWILCENKDIKKTNVLKTYINGKLVWFKQ